MDIKIAIEGTQEEIERVRHEAKQRDLSLADVIAEALHTLFPAPLYPATNVYDVRTTVTASSERFRSVGVS